MHTSKENYLANKQLTSHLQIFSSNTIDFTEGPWAQRMKSNPDGFEKQIWDLTLKCLNQMNQMHPPLCTAHRRNQHTTSRNFRSLLLSVRIQVFPPHNGSCMDSVIAKLQNVKWKGQKNQFIEHSDPALMCNAVQASQYKPVINVSDQLTNCAWLNMQQKRKRSGIRDYLSGLIYTDVQYFNPNQR